ncbi:hypothetical protein TNCV_3107441 [Trichonephila clavipes]|nr:hypothetical protein TNCV_3107441 [Trichonephila clavipes]
MDKEEKRLKDFGVKRWNDMAAKIDQDSGEQSNPAGAVSKGSIGFELLMGKACRWKGEAEGANSTLHAEIVEVEIEVVSPIYRPFGEFRRAKIALSPVWCSRPMTGVPLAHATMNFVGLDLTTSDRSGSSPALNPIENLWYRLETL